MDNELIFRLATKDDIYDIVQMLLDDPLGATRENISDTLSPRYLQAFEKINADPNQELTVVEMNGNKVATFQLTFIQGLSHHGGLRAQVEAVRTHASFRGQGIGTRVFQYVINRARQKGCVLVQLTSDKRRPRAIKFYETLGFAATHEGMKLKL